MRRGFPGRLHGPGAARHVLNLCVAGTGASRPARVPRAPDRVPPARMARPDSVPLRATGRRRRRQDTTDLPRAPRCPPEAREACRMSLDEELRWFGVDLQAVAPTSRTASCRLPIDGTGGGEWHDDLRLATFR